MQRQTPASPFQVPLGQALCLGQSAVRMEQRQKAFIFLPFWHPRFGQQVHSPRYMKCNLLLHLSSFFCLLLGGSVEGMTIKLVFLVYFTQISFLKLNLYPSGQYIGMHLYYFVEKNLSSLHTHFPSSISKYISLGQVFGIHFKRFGSHFLSSSQSMFVHVFVSF